MQPDLNYLFMKNFKTHKVPHIVSTPSEGHSPASIVVCGNYGANNLGDEAILGGILTVLKKNFPAADYSIMSADPEKTLKHCHQSQISGFLPADLKFTVVGMIPSGVRTFLKTAFNLNHWKKFRTTCHAIKKADLFVLGGGGLFNDEQPKSVWIWFLQVLPAIFFKKNIYCLGQSVGPLKTFAGKTMTRFVMKRAKLIVVRDHFSQELLNKLEIKNVHLLPDLVFALKINPQLNFVKTSFYQYSDHPYVVLSLRQWKISAKKNETNFQNLAAWIDWLYKYKKIKTVMIPFQQLSGQDDDTVTFKQIVGKLYNSEAAEIKTYSGDLLKILQLIKNARAVVGMRLHSLIFATIVNTPFLGLSYSQKVKAFLKSLENENYLFDWVNFSTGNLLDGFEKLEKDRTELKQKLLHKSLFFAHELNKYDHLLLNSCKGL